MQNFPTRQIALMHLPFPLTQTEKPPFELFIQGSPEAFELLQRLPRDGFAVVGTRRPQQRSLQQVRSALRSLQHSRLIIISGLALGIDAAAHEEALRARLPTVAILGSPLEEIYPREHRELAHEILRSGGLLVTEIPPDGGIQPHYFRERNRLIASWSMATWVVEAGFRSGALTTAAQAVKHNREVYATPCFPEDLAMAGNQKLLIGDEAKPFWAATELTHTWPDLFKQARKVRSCAALPLFAAGNLDSPEIDASQDDAGAVSDSQLLAFEVAARTSAQGGARVEDVLEWSLALGWDPSRFFTALQESLNLGQIEDLDGILSCS
jgi:DNA protecting protein DprA